MAQSAAAALDPAPAPSSALNASAQGYAAKIEAASEGLGPKLAAIGNATDAKVSSIEAERGALKAPELKQVPEPIVQSTDPQHVWGSAAMAMAVIGSTLTRQPLTTAMNAGAMVLNAYKAGDQARANAAYQTWKVSSENAMAQANFERESYRDAMVSLDRREKQATDAGDRQERDAISAVNALGHAFNDPMMAEVKSASDAARIMEERQRHADQLAAQAGRLEEQFMSVQALNALKATPEWNTQQNPSVPLAVQQFHMMRETLHHTAPTQEAEMIRQARAGRQKIMDQMNAYKASKGGYLDPTSPDPTWANLTAQLQAADDILADIGSGSGGSTPKLPSALETGSNTQSTSTPDDIKNSLKADLAPPPSSAPKPPAPPVGTTRIYDGHTYRFEGGDVANQGNWKRIG